jgi:hypothetical protein
MKQAIALLGLLIGTCSYAATGQYSGLNLEQANSLQMQLCSLKPGKSMANYSKVVDSYIKWSKENDVEVFVLRAMPMFVSQPPNANMGFDFLEMLMGPYDVSGRGWTKWLTSEEGQKLNAQWQDAADCRVVLNPAVMQVIDQTALNARDDRVMVMNWCTRKDGVTWDQLEAKHQQVAAGWTADSPLKAWGVMYPSLGMRDAPGEFANILSFEDANGLMAWQNNLANNGGWRMREDYMTSYASCSGDNVYYAEVLNRPGS